MSTKDQLAQALRTSVAAGYPIVLNVMTCCRGCATVEDVQVAYDKQAEAFDLPPVAFEENAPNAVWHFGGQDNRIAFSYAGDPERIEDDECQCYEIEDEFDEDDEGNEVLIREGELVECRISREGPRRFALNEFMLRHASTDAANAALRALREAGISAEWNGSDMECIGVHL